MKLTTQAAARTDVGIVRKNNEDSFGFDIRAGIFVVCDGVGGVEAGEVASRIAVDTVLEYFSSPLTSSRGEVLGRKIAEVSESANALANAIQLANSAIRDAAAQGRGSPGMGSTIVAVLVAEDLFAIAHVGDSRIYLIRSGAMQQLTTDHSLLMEQVRRGMITLEEAEESETQNVIVRALGSDDSVEPDLADLNLQEHDVILLCSDGLCRFAKETTMLEVIQEHENLDDACRSLIDAAKAANSDDNITCLLIRAVEKTWGTRIFARLRNDVQTST